jgi:hypothetical protein
MDFKEVGWESVAWNPFDLGQGLEAFPSEHGNDLSRSVKERKFFD